MTGTARLFLALAAAFGLLGVAAGAFGVHGLKSVLEPDLLVVFETGARYQMYHALALLIVAVLAGANDARSLRVAGWLFAAGVVVFSGSLYALALTGIRGFGAVTPLGGLALLGGWIALLAAAVGTPRRSG